MTENKNTSLTRLVYNGEVIRDRNEMLSLTDMWKAAGSPSGRAPADWRALTSTAEFASHVAEFLNAGKSGNELFKTIRGGTSPGTWGHWQLAMSYAKYLSPEFHMWCNTVVRERMEGTSQAGVPATMLEEVTRSFGILRQLIHKVTVIEKHIAIPPPIDIEAAIRSELAKQSYLLRRGKTAGQIWRDNKFPPLKNAPSWFGNRLEKMGCRIPDKGRAEMGVTTARLFDPDKAEVCLDNGLRIIVEQKIAERMGQRKLRLVGQAEQARAS